jgi:UDP-N-acetylmuramyl pentapeptide phosphotransferase/UDP-N-acetylglucosamine-1-phosphate transferase
MKKFDVSIIVTLLLASAIAAWWLEPTGWLAIGIVALAMSFAMMFFAARSILFVSHRKKLYDNPGGRHIHTTPTPRLAGIAFAPIIFCTSILALGLHQSLAPEYHTAIPACLMWISALTFIHMTGVVDDMVGVRYSFKFLAQTIAALLVVASGFWINDLGGIFGIHEVPASMGMPLTVLFIVGVINAFNLIDGMDGLSSGIAIIAFAIYGIHSFLAGQYFFSVVSLAALGTLLPFSYINVYGLGRGRRKLFMGDTGSQTLGMALAVLAVGQLMNGGSTPLTPERLVLVLSPLIIPVFDVIHVMFFRMLHGKHPFHPDKTHIHHRFLDLGLNQSQALGAILYMVVVYTAGNIVLSSYLSVTWVLVIDAAVWLATNGAISVLAQHRKAVANGIHKNKIKTSINHLQHV